MGHANGNASQMAHPSLLQAMMFDINIPIARADKRRGNGLKLINHIRHMQISRVQNTVHAIESFMHLRPQIGDRTRHMRICNQPDTQPRAL